MMNLAVYGCHSSATVSMQCPLPPEVLQLVPQHVDLPQRLGPCALVCRAWHAAANAATSSVSITADRRRATALSDWLQRHGGQVEQLQVKGSYPEVSYSFDLPCQQLTNLDKLEVIQMDVGLITSSSNSGTDSPGHQQQHLAALTQLTHLHLNTLKWAGSLQPLSALTNLRHLQLDGITCPGDTCTTDGALHGAVGGAVPHLVQLTTLHLQDCNVFYASLAHISRLQQLRELQVVDLQQPIISTLAVPQSLTLLVLGDSRSPLIESITSSTAPALAQLTVLQHLELRGGWYVDPVVLSQMAQLTHLLFYPSGLLPDDRAGAAALLTAIAGMTLLQHLQLDCDDRSHACAPAAAYAALTASSHLTYLHLRHYDKDDDKGGEVVPLPAGALNHMFAAGRQLPSLQNLCVYVHKQRQDVGPNRAWVLEQQGFDQLLQCCSGLQSLELGCYDGVDDFGVDEGGGRYPQPIKLDGLLALSGLSQLHLDGMFLDDRGFSSTLVQLTGLQELDIDYSGVSHTALLQLTKLQQLKSLRLHSGHDRQYFSNPGSRCVYQAGMIFIQPVNRCVWQQLQEHCVTKYQECAGLVLVQLHEAQEQLAAQQAQHEAQLAEARQQLAAQQAEARQQLAAQQAQHEAQVAGVMQQLAAQLAQHETQLARLQQQLL